MTSEANENWYVISPDGGAWVAVQVDHHGEIVRMVEEANAATHIAANDRLAAICQAVRDCEVDEHVPADTARQIIAQWNADADPDSAVVERIVFAD